jgi:DNA-binding MarR family transcriptional regulator
MTTRSPTDAHRRRDAWYATVRAHSALGELMEKRLEAAVAMPLAWYDVLVNLYLAPGHALRMSELADTVVLSRSWLTRRVDQLEKAGLVERCSADGDGRGVRARLTREGKRAYLKMERVHSAVVDEFFASHATATEADSVRRVMDRVAASARRELGLPELPVRSAEAR